eukprot:gene29014-29410_t
MLLLLMVTSKGMAGVPRASLVVIMATLTYFGMDEAWIALVLAVDHLLDMGRSATNVVGNSVASAVVARWEGKRGAKEPTDGDICVVTIDRPQARNAVDGVTAQALYEAFKGFDADEALSVAILTGAHGNFCAGADLKGVAAGAGNPVRREGDLGPMGPTRLALSKPVIAAVEGYAVAGGLELALWCDLRVAAEGATFGVFCRRFGVPLIDLGTVRL